MTKRPRPRLRWLRLLGQALLSVLMLCGLTDVACPDGRPESAADVAPRRLEQITPGTVIGKEAPKGWSHLILKSYSKPGAGDVNQLSPTAERLTRLLFSAIVADVRAERTADGGRRYRLAKVAVGLGTRVGGKDTVITPDTQKRLGADLGLLARVVLRTAQEKLAETTLVARSAGLTVFDSPSLLLVEGRHRPVVLRYAVLVSEKTGRLDTLLWVLSRDDDGKYGGPLGPMRLLRANLTDDCVLHVDGREFSLGQPTEKAFALTAPPKGREEIPVGDDLRPLAVRARFSPAAAAELEGKLREAINRE